MFYDTLQALCAERNLSVSAALNIMGMSAGNMTYWRKGKLPSGKALNRISRFFGVPVDMLTKSAQAEMLTREQVRWLHLFDLLSAEDKALATAQMEQFVRSRIGDSPYAQNQI
jgi:transcriptional regulator with XRE-family HTH domain